MKNNSTQFINLALLTCCLIFSGCDKFLNVNPGILKELTIISVSEDYAKLLVGALYRSPARVKKCPLQLEEIL